MNDNYCGEQTPMRKARDTAFEAEMQATSGTRSWLAQGAELLSEGKKAVSLLRQMVKVASNDGKPFAPVHYDYDSLDNRDTQAVERLLSMVADPMQRYFKADVRGLEHATKGPVLFVGNHNGGAWSPEIFLFGAALYRRYGLAALPYGLAHETVAQIPPLARILIPVGAVRASHENAARIFTNGQNVLVYPGGDEEALRPSRQRDEIQFGGRRGYIRLALRHGVPIVPVVTFGAHDVFVVLDDGRWLARRLGLHKSARIKVFPTILSVPWGVTMGPVMPFIPLPARIRIQVLQPIEFSRKGEQAAQDSSYVEACDRQVRGAMQATLSAMALRLRQDPVPPSLLPPALPENDQSRSASRVAG